MADAFYNKIKDLKLLNNWENYIPYEEAIQDIPVSQIDSIQGILVINKLKKSWPYNINYITVETDSAINNNLKDKYTEVNMAQDINLNIRKWDDAMAIAYKMYESDEDYEKALDIAQTLIFEYPEQGIVYKMAGDMCIKLGNYKKAAFYYFRFNYFKESKESAEKLATAYIKLSQLNEAKKTLSEAKKNGLNVSSLAELVEEITGD